MMTIKRQGSGLNQSCYYILIYKISAFVKIKEKTELENPTVVFYPDGTSETK